MDVPDEGPKFCETCPDRATCQRICEPLERYLGATCGTHKSLRATAFSALPEPQRRALANDAVQDRRDLVIDRGVAQIAEGKALPALARVVFADFLDAVVRSNDAGVIPGLPKYARSPE